METNPKSKIAQNITGLLLCAGLSGRMGTLKALMLYNCLPFAVQITKKLLLVCNKVVVVVGHDSDKVIVEIKKHLSAEETSKVIFVLNENYQAGMFTSLQCGLRNISGSDWILYHFVDQPSLPDSFYYEFVEQSLENINWVQPAYKKKLGHPVLFNHNVTDMILQLSENNSLRDLSNDQSINKQILNCNYPQVLHDIDTIDEFEKLKYSP